MANLHRQSTKTLLPNIISIICLLLVAYTSNLNAQNTPIAIDNNPTNDCAGSDCWDWFNWSTVQDGGGNNIGGDGIAEDTDCGNSIGATVEYTGPDSTPDFTGTLVGANTTDGTTPDVWTFNFDQALTNPVFDVNSLENDTQMCFTDCLGNPLTITILGTSLDPGPSGAHCVTSGTNFIQVTGTYDCIVVTGTVPDNDPYTLGVGTCLAFDPPPPTPPCISCPMGTDYELVSLDQTGTNPSTGFPTGNIEINNVCIGSYEFLFSDLDVNEDGNGTQFGGWDIDGGTMLLQLDFCDPLIIQQLDIRNLEVESEVSVGTTLSGSGATAVLGGQTLTVCSDPSGRMGVEANPDNGEMNFVKTDGPGCSANPNGSYTFGTNPVTTLYFKYHNPPGGCTGDYVGFRLGTCYTPPPMAAPVCPVEIVQVTCDMQDVIANGPNNANTDEYAVDGNGNYFDFSSCSATLENAIINGTILQTVDIGCAELVQTTEECIIAACVIIPHCATCPTESTFDYISLDQDGTNPSGFPMGTVNLDNVLIGTYEFLYSDLDVSEDGNGTTFGGWDNDGGTLLLQLDFCDPLTIQELEVRNLEVESQVSIGTTIVGAGAAAILGGQTLTICDDPSGRMGVGPAPNEVITDGPGCGANPNGTYTVGTNPVTTLYFKYHNPPGGCLGDYVGFRIGACVPTLLVATPSCDLEVFEIDDNPSDPNNATYLAVRDDNGIWFDYNDLPDMGMIVDLVPINEIRISPCASITAVCGSAQQVMLDTGEVCRLCFTVPIIGDVTCNPIDPVVGMTFDINITGLENMKGVDNNEADFGLNVYLYPEEITQMEIEANYPPNNAITIAEALSAARPLTVPVLLGSLAPNELINNCTEGFLSVFIPHTFPTGTYQKVITLDMAPTLSPDSKPLLIAPAGPVNVVPTLGQWALIVLGLMMILMAVISIREPQRNVII